MKGEIGLGEFGLSFWSGKGSIFSVQKGVLLMKYRAFLFCMAATLVLHGQGFSQTVSAGTGGDFATLTLAIQSFQSGGSNASNPATNVINCLDPSYDELLPLIDVQLTINGAVGRSTILGQVNANSDGFELNPPASETIELNDLILLPSTTGTPTDDLISILGGTDSQVTFNRCVVSSNFSGAPLSLDGFTAPTATPDAQVSDNGLNITGGFATVNLNETIVTLACGPVTSVTPDNILMTGADKNTLNINAGSVISYGQYRNIQANNVDDLNIVGTKANPVILLGPDGVQIGCYLLSTGNLVIDHCIMADSVASVAHVDNAIAIDQQSPDRPTSITNTLIINNNGPGIRLINNYNSTMVVKNVTIAHNANGSSATVDVAQILTDALGASANITIEDTIIAGGKTGIDIAGGNINLSYSALVLSGPDALAAAIAGAGTVTQTAVITQNPVFQETSDLASSDLFDVHAATYGGKGSGGSDLAGGADYIGDYVVLSSRNWTLFE